MNTRYLISVLVIFVLLMVFGFVVHAQLLSADYQKITPTIMRGPEDGARHMGYIIRRSRPPSCVVRKTERGTWDI